MNVSYERGEKLKREPVWVVLVYEDGRQHCRRALANFADLGFPVLPAMTFSAAPSGVVVAIHVVGVRQDYDWPHRLDAPLGVMAPMKVQLPSWEVGL